MFFALGFARATYRVLWSAVILAAPSLPCSTYCRLLLVWKASEGRFLSGYGIALHADRSHRDAGGRAADVLRTPGRRGMGLSSFMEATLAMSSGRRGCPGTCGYRLQPRLGLSGWGCWPSPWGPLFFLRSGAEASESLSPHTLSHPHDYFFALIW